MTNIMELSREHLFAAIAPEEDDPSLAAFRELARDLSIFLHVGSLAIKASPEKAANRSFLIDPKGEIIARYDKIHMFDVDLDGGESYRESLNFRPGELAVLADLPWGRLGLSICYDLRFPALYRALAEAGASVLTIPRRSPGRRARRIGTCCIRARAIENGCFVLAAAQGGAHENGRETFGHSLIGRSLGPHPGRRRHRAWRRDGRHRSRRGGRRARAHSLAAAWPPLRNHRADGGACASACGRRPRMIRYALVCDRKQNSKAGFTSSADYDKQAKRGLVTCPACGSSKVEKAIMAPSISRAGKRHEQATLPTNCRATPPAPAEPAPGCDAVAAGAASSARS